jgi:hypothetical protein
MHFLTRLKKVFEDSQQGPQNEQQIFQVKMFAR